MKICQVLSYKALSPPQIMNDGNDYDDGKVFLFTWPVLLGIAPEAITLVP